MTGTTVALPALDDRRPVDAATVSGFTRDGHTVVRGLAAPDEVAAFRPSVREATLRASQDVAPLEERTTYGKAFLQVPNLWRLDPTVARFVLAHRFAATAAQLLGVDKVRVYHDQALFKEPGGGITPWHQDSVYWPFETDLTVTMWMPLVDLAEDMGGLSFASTSQQGRALADVAISDESEAYYDTLVAERGFLVVDYGAMAAGDATFHAGWTLHRARPNESRTLREVMTVIWYADGLRAAEPRNDNQVADLATWLPGVAPGEPAVSELNPLLP